MLTLKHLLCAEIISRDADTNKISVFNIYEGAEAEGYPLLLANFSILAVLQRDLADEQRPSCSLKLALDNTEVLRNPVNVDFQDKRLTRSIVKIEGFVVERAGTLTVTFLRGDNPMGTVTIEFTQRTPSQLHITSTTG